MVGVVSCHVFTSVSCVIIYKYFQMLSGMAEVIPEQILEHGSGSRSRTCLECWEQSPESRTLSAAVVLGLSSQR